MSFDRPLVAAGVLDTGNWAVRVANNLHVITGVSASGNAVTVLLGGLIPNVGPDQVTYSPPPFDVLGENGAAAKSFSGFPVT